MSRQRALFGGYLIDNSHRKLNFKALRRSRIIGTAQYILIPGIDPQDEDKRSRPG